MIILFSVSEITRWNLRKVRESKELLCVWGLNSKITKYSNEKHLLRLVHTTVRSFTAIWSSISFCQICWFTFPFQFHLPSPSCVSLFFRFFLRYIFISFPLQIISSSFLTFIWKILSIAIHHHYKREKFEFLIEHKEQKLSAIYL